MNSVKIVVAFVIFAAFTYFMLPAKQTADPDKQSAGAALASVVMPAALSDNAVVGQKAYEAKCAACHAGNGAGQQGVAPPLIHKIYEPSHHADEAFQRAAGLGVKSHHWPFGDMPAVDGLTRADVKMIIAYIREVQRHNGIN